jgi:hypothetical protein
VRQPAAGEQFELPPHDGLIRRARASGRVSNQYSHDNQTSGHDGPQRRSPGCVSRSAAWLHNDQWLVAPRPRPGAGCPAPGPGTGRAAMVRTHEGRQGRDIETAALGFSRLPASQNSPIGCVRPASRLHPPSARATPPTPLHGKRHPASAPPQSSNGRASIRGQAERPRHHPHRRRGHPATAASPAVALADGLYSNQPCSVRASVQSATPAPGTAG